MQNQVVSHEDWLKTRLELHAAGKELTRQRDAGGSAGIENAAVLSAADWLCLAAAPTFAIMALVTGVAGGGPADLLCATQDVSPLSGMVPMYMLMTAFHSAPWLKLIFSRRCGARRC